MSAQRPPLPNPIRMEPVLPAGVVLGLHIVCGGFVAVFGGGALSALLCLRGPAAPGWHELAPTLARLTEHWSDPAAAWPADPRPGPAWLTWICMILVAIAWCSAVAIVGAEIDSRRRHRRRRVGLATRGDLRRIGLDPYTAARKSAAEFPEQARREPRRYRRRWRR
ncbi:hypothetical protein ACQPW1_11450 [Nocardia sp. CA-128927]|uniref:hypothetical protein n=1 Tax=Nocardia sp. CA-128927 TaxID=3239975 RepID=UPI003D979D08